MNDQWVGFGRFSWYANYSLPSSELGSFDDSLET